ncbi:MAG: retropepsin-like aspartic protease [Pseudomonadota bacterium]
MRPQRRDFIQGALCAATACCLAAEKAKAATPFDRDPKGRPIVPVKLNGVGPFRFILDTGANRTVITPSVVSLLNLAPGGARLVDLARLEAGDLSCRDFSAVVMSGEMLGPYDGLLGMDALQGARLSIDFERGVFETGPGGAEAPPGFDPVPGRLRFGYLLETQIEIKGVAAPALIDSGSQSTIVNSALLARVPDAPTAGRSIVLGVREGEVRFARLFSDVKVGRLRIKQLRVHPEELEPYRDEAGREQPGLLLGIDALSAARAVAIDFVRAELQIAIGEQNLVWARNADAV